MEDKERFEIHIYDDCNVDLYDNGVLDKSITNEIELEKLLNQQDKRIKELEALLKTAREFETPRISRYAVVQYFHWKNRPYKIVKCYDCYKDKDMKTVYCYYGVKSTNFKVIKICDTVEEANSLIKELRENRCNG